MNEDIKQIESELLSWQRDNCNMAFLDALKKEDTIVLKYKYRKIKEFEKYIKKFEYNPTYVESGNIFLLKKALRREMRIRHWYWPLANFCTPVSFLRWYVNFFRGKDLMLADKNFGLRTSIFLKSKKTWWQKDLSIILHLPPFFRKKSTDIVIILIAGLTLLFMVYTHYYPRNPNTNQQPTPTGDKNNLEKFKP